jgi:5-methylcytosine-specific restriction endonuclease McrA
MTESVEAGRRRRYRKEHPGDDHRYRQENLEKHRAACRLWVKGNPDKVRANQRRWEQENPEKVAARKARYYQKHREEAVVYSRRRQETNPDYQRRYQQEHPEKVAANNARRAARKQRLPDTLTTEEAEYLFLIGRAVYRTEKLELDHIVPLSKGGGTTRANMHAIPLGLNRSKQNMLPEEIYKQGEILSTAETRNG